MHVVHQNPSQNPVQSSPECSAEGRINFSLLYRWEIKLSNTQETWLKLHEEFLSKQNKDFSLSTGAGQFLYGVCAHVVCVVTDASIFSQKCWEESSYLLQETKYVMVMFKIKITNLFHVLFTFWPVFSGADRATRCRWKNAHWLWWGHELHATSLVLSLQQDLSYSFLGWGRHHSWHSRAKRVQPITVSSTSWQSWRKDGKKALSDYSPCMCFGRENTVHLWARILP